MSTSPDSESCAIAAIKPSELKFGRSSVVSSCSDLDNGGGKFDVMLAIYAGYCFLSNLSLSLELMRHARDVARIE